MQNLVVSASPQVILKVLPQRANDTHKNQGGIQIFVVFLLKVSIMFFHFSLELVVELHSGVNPRSSASQHGLQGIAESLFQSVATE